MTPGEIQAAIDSLEAELTARASGQSATRVREGDREIEFRDVSEAEIRRRLGELKALLAGEPARTPARRVLF